MTKNSEVSNKIALFGMRNLMLETELLKIEHSGIELGHKETLKEDEVVDTDLFEEDILKTAKKMAGLYVLYFAFENSVRRLISTRLMEKYGANWWGLKVPQNIQQEVVNRKQREVDSAMSVRSDDPLTYTTFGELIEIFDVNWVDFADTIRSQKAMQKILSSLNQLRGVVAHSAELNEDEILRFKLSIKDWLRIQA